MPLVVMTGQFRLPVARRAEAQAAMARIITASRAEPGCIEYTFAEDVLDPGLFRVIEHWESRAALDLHWNSAHMNVWREEREALGMTERLVTAYDVNGQDEL